MANTAVFLLTVIAVASWSLTALYHYRYQLLEYEKVNKDEILQRSRRDLLGPSSSPSEKNGLFNNIEELRKFIQEETNRTIQRLVEVSVNNRISNHCKCPDTNRDGITKEQGQPGPKGDVGPRGPPGPKGEPGLGLYPAELTGKLLNVTAKVGEMKEFSCTFFGNPLPITQWNASFSNMDVGREIDQEKSIVTTRLYVRNITWDDRGSVGCSASNILGSANATGTLSVHAPPIISIPEGPVSGLLGLDITFPQCKAQTNPAVLITWQRGISNLPKGRTFNRDGILRISNLKVKDEGYYICIATNYLGTTRKYVQLRVRPLEFSRKPKSYIFSSNSSVTLTCAAHAAPGMLFGKWRNSIDGKVIHTAKIQTRNEILVSTIVNETGTYSCTIANYLTTINSDTQVELFKLQTNMIDATQVRRLGLMLKGSNKVGEYRLCWSGRDHGFNTSTFRTYCGGKPNTVAIIRNKRHRVFGGFTDYPWPHDTMVDMHTDTHTGCGGSIYRPSKVVYVRYRRSFSNRIRCSWSIILDRPVRLDFPKSAKRHCLDVKENGIVKRFCTTYLNRTFVSSGNGKVVVTYAFTYTGATSFIISHAVEYRYSTQSFVFSLHPGVIKVPAYDKQKAVCHDRRYAICFGESEMYTAGNSTKFALGKSYMYPGKQYLSRVLRDFYEVEIDDVEVHYKV